MDQWFAQQVKYPEAVLAWYQFDPIVADFETAFGKDTVTVLPFEALKQMPDWFAARLAELLDLREESVVACRQAPAVNTAPTAREVKLKSITRKLHLPSPVREGLLRLFRPLLKRFLQRGKALEVKLTEEQAAYIEEQFRPAHRWLVERYGLPLRELGYAVD